MQNYQLTHHQNYSKIAFNAMASPCEVLIRNLNPLICDQIAKIVIQETTRIESKFSRYIKGNLVDRMNKSCGLSINIDQETFQLLEYARNLYELSDGLFDITSGVLRKIWTFTPDSKPPQKKEIAKQLKNIGFELVDYNQTIFRLPKGMQVDFGGIGKEYAVDQVAKMIRPLCQSKQSSFVVNFGGDLSAEQFKLNDPAWVIGLESADNHNNAESVIKLAKGSVATSGNTKRFFEYQGKRYGHLLNPKTGYPIDGAPRSVTVFSDSCVLAGTFSSLAMLQASEAETFLKEQAIEHICIW